MEVESEAYQSHRIFTDLKLYIDFYESLSMSVFLFITMGTKAIANIDSYTYSSMQGTLESIRTLLLNGRINDAYALLRKYYDSVIINIYTNLYLDEHFSMDQLKVDNFIVEKIQNWLSEKVPLPRNKDMHEYIRHSRKVTPVTSALLSDGRYKSIRDRCNDHTHYNYYQLVLLNDNKISLPNRLQYLALCRNDIRDIVILHLAFIFYIKDVYMMSSDYLDALECNMQPEPDSQYWVAPFIQKFFDNIVTPYRPEVTNLIKNASDMQLT